MANVRFEHVEKEYAEGSLAVAGIDLEIADGELMVVVGPSGCGKSTLLRMLAGLETITRGTLRIGDRVVNDLSPQERNVAMVFQDYALYPHMTVRGNLEFPLRMRRMAKDEMAKRIDWAAQTLGLGEKLDRLPKQLSGGERQRVAMGRALVREPTVSLLDEPLSNLDAKLRTEVRAEIADLQRRTKTTMMYVTHDQVEAMTLGQRITILDRGRLQQTGTPREVYERPANAFVAGFMGSPPMNVFAAVLVLESGGPRLRVGDDRIAVDLSAVPEADVRALAGKPISAGIRAEAIELAREAAEGSVAATVEHVELLGHETLVVAKTAGGVRLLIRLPAMRPLAPQAAVRLVLDPGSIYVFDADGRTVPGSAPSVTRTR